MPGTFLAGRGSLGAAEKANQVTRKPAVMRSNSTNTPYPAGRFNSPDACAFSFYSDGYGGENNSSVTQTSPLELDGSQSRQGPFNTHPQNDVCSPEYTPGVELSVMHETTTPNMSNGSASSSSLSTNATMLLAAPVLSGQGLLPLRNTVTEVRNSDAVGRNEEDTVNSGQIFGSIGVYHRPIVSTCDARVGTEADECLGCTDSKTSMGQAASDLPFKDETIQRRFAQTQKALLFFTVISEDQLGL
ncbi:unnamed protein product [Protopolystoma xenopodis]|uniref:Uncharacterized protein n=1 Tax=Protopolystoma xenopodis TaxID=117903 RepID=A0A3S5FC05_9PLAT|nr:unnamed protein product [Protopolystoma xenopodis]